MKTLHQILEAYTQQDQNRDFDRCKRTAIALHDKAKKEGKDTHIYRCSGYRGNGKTAHPKWKSMKPFYWIHYVTSIDGKIHDPTARQFDTSHPTEYDHDHLKKNWLEVNEVQREHL